MLALYAKVYGISNADAYREICEALQTGDYAPEYQSYQNQQPQEIAQSARAPRQDVYKRQGHTIRLRLVPLFHAGIYLGKRTRAIQIPIPECHCFRCFPSVLPERKLPVVKPLIVWVPCLSLIHISGSYKRQPGRHRQFPAATS